MPQSITRTTKVIPNLALTTSSTTTPEIIMAGFAGGSILIPSGSSITTLTFYGAAAPTNDPEGVGNNGYGPLHTNDSLDTAITLTVSAGNMYQLPTAIFALGALKITGNAAGAVDLVFKG